MLPSKKLNLPRRFICPDLKLNERGFFTIVGVCLLLVSAIFIKGIQEFEADYSRGVTNFQAEHQLQNLAESYLIEQYHNLPKFNGTYKFSEKVGTYGKLKNVEVVVWAQRQENIPMKDGEITLRDDTPGTVLVSVASCDSLFVAGKIYRRAFAYILDNDPETEIDESATIYFVNQLLKK